VRRRRIRHANILDIETTLYNWNAEFGGMDVFEAKRLKAVGRKCSAKKLLADETPDAAALRGRLSKTMVGPAVISEAVAHHRAVMGLSEHRACRIVTSIARPCAIVTVTG
jgi:hypothetical protein